MHRRNLPELFAGNEPLFRGLAIHPHWDWTIRYSVIHLSFGGGVLPEPRSLRGPERRPAQRADGRSHESRARCHRVNPNPCVFGAWRPGI